MDLSPPSAMTAAPVPPSHSRVSVSLPSGPLGISISRRASDGECLVVPPSSPAPLASKSLLEYGDVILSLNGIRLTTVEGGLPAWVTLFQAFGATGTRNLVVLRPTTSMAQDVSSNQSKLKAPENPAAATTVTPAAVPPARKSDEKGLEPAETIAKRVDQKSAVDYIVDRAAPVTSPMAKPAATRAGTATLTDDEKRAIAIRELKAAGVFLPPMQASAGNKHTLSESTNASVQMQPAQKKPKIAVSGARSYSTRDIERLVKESQPEKVQALVVNIWTGGAAMRSNKPLDEFMTLLDCTSCCFLCKRRYKHGHIEIFDNGDVAVCRRCANSKEKFNLTEVVETFGISKSDARSLPHSTGISGYGGIKYCFSNRTVIDAIRYDSSLQRKVRKEAFFKRNYICMRFTKDKFNEAKTDEVKRKVLKWCVELVGEKQLREFAVKSLQKVPKSRVGQFVTEL